jgi:hypothetical protein
MKLPRFVIAEIAENTTIGYSQLCAVLRGCLADFRGTCVELQKDPTTPTTVGRFVFVSLVTALKVYKCQNHRCRNCCRRFNSQAYSIFSPGRSGRRLRVDFVGHVESLESDWQRLLSAMTPAAVTLSPAERRSLIQAMPPPKSPPLSGELPSPTLKLRVGPAHDSNRQPVATVKGGQLVANQTGSPRFTVEQELQVCRRYLQDFACFGYGVPRSCIEHAYAVL